MIADLLKEEETVQFRNRTGRLAKWRELCIQAAKDLELPPAAPERITYLDDMAPG